MTKHDHHMSAAAAHLARLPPARSEYAGTAIAMGTMHGKERQAAPAFAEELGANVFAPAGIDTDQFGTFTAEVTRTLTPLAAATAKARLAMHIATVPYGLASEASYTTWYGTIALHEEIMVFVDDIRMIQVVEGLNTPGAPGFAQLIDTADQAVAAAVRFGFPQQGAAVKAKANNQIQVFGKGIIDPATLIAVSTAALRASDSNQAWVEPDLRAHHNPSRRDVLAALARKLARRLATPCPHCRCPGYGTVGVQPGLPCQDCEWPTSLIAADIFGCPACEERTTVQRHPANAEPRYCPQCNP
ncbi:MAG: hypothetical protein K2Q25_14735 [Mycobacteriaceae bacterium]|nr:hypothetical protein [Mycobacteriaceae bacterium]